ncbi:GreA/GreB family elongation factor [Thalassotalea insulae]|nr:GreA/GreB family elongation factor [Thalassotalea insulae]
MKQQIINKVIEHLKQELTAISAAAKAAHSAAIDEQSIAETQYDTLAIEASYLAQGQSLRAQQLNQAINQIKSLSLATSNKVTLGSLVHLEQAEQGTQWFMILPAAPGFRCTIEQQEITVITPDSPVGKSLQGKQIDDEITLQLGTRKVSAEIIQLR